MRRIVSAYILGDKAYLHGSKRTLRTTPILTEPVFELDIDSDISDLGKAIRTCVESYSEGHPHPSREDFKRLNDPLIKKAKQKSYTSFFSRTKFVPIVEKNNVIVFAPSENHGRKGVLKIPYIPILNWTIALLQMKILA